MIMVSDDHLYLLSSHSKMSELIDNRCHCPPLGLQLNHTAATCQKKLYITLQFCEKNNNMHVYISMYN